MEAKKNTTNNRMEMTAILKSLVELPNGTEVTILSDSCYCVDGLTKWRAGWKRRNWTRKDRPLPNRDLWFALETHLDRLSVDIKWVKAHNGDTGNEKDDQLATRGRALNGKDPDVSTEDKLSALVFKISALTYTLKSKDCDESNNTIRECIVILNSLKNRRN